MIIYHTYKRDAYPAAFSMLLSFLFLFFSHDLEARGQASKEALLGDYDGDGPPLGIIQRGKIKELELCAGDWCQLVKWTTKSPDQDPAAWDAVLLMFYFFDANEIKQKNMEGAIKITFRKYAANCPADNLSYTTADCILNIIAKKNKLEYARVQYDIGHRCVSVFQPQAPHFEKKGTCTKIY